MKVDWNKYFTGNKDTTDKGLQIGKWWLWYMRLSDVCQDMEQNAQVDKMYDAIMLLCQES